MNIVATIQRAAKGYFRRRRDHRLSVLLSFAKSTCSLFFFPVLFLLNFLSRQIYVAAIKSTLDDGYQNQITGSFFYVSYIIYL